MFVHLFPGIKEQSRIKSEWLVGEIFIGVYTYEDGYMGGWKRGAFWVMSDSGLDLSSCSQGKVGRGETENSWHATVAFTVPRVVMYEKISQPGMVT